MDRAKVLLILSLALLVTGAVWGQDTQALLESYLRNFDKGDLATKLELIQDAAKRNNASLAPLFKHTIDFVVNKSSRGKNDSILRQLCHISLDQLEAFKFSEARWLVWQLFLADADTNIKIKSLKALTVLASGDKIIIQNLNVWLANQISAFKAGQKPELGVILRCVLTLGGLGDESSFVVIFNTIIANFTQEISNAAQEILVKLKGNFKELIVSIIQTGSIREKKEILIIALAAESLNEKDKAEIAELALNEALRSSSVQQKELKDIREIRILANRALSTYKRKEATKLILQYFEVALVEYEKGLLSKPDLLEIIRCLGNMERAEAAHKLTEYLGLLNLYTEQKKVYDEQIVIETINSLGRLGQKLAFDVLMNVRFLPYNTMIKSKAEEALQNLKW